MTVTLNFALVLAGGSALGAYEGGAYEALAAAGLTPGWIAGSSIGALNAGIIAGNRPETRVARLREFWQRASAPGSAVGEGGVLTRSLQITNALRNRFLGRPGVFRLNFSGLFSIVPGAPDEPALYDLSPLRETLSALIDIGRLNSGEVRLSVQAVDVVSGEPIVFDTAHQQVTLDHLIASASLMPDFPPVTIDGRDFVDGGFTANAPVGIILDSAPERDLLCLVIDLFPIAGPRPRSWFDGMQRRDDLIFSQQTANALREHAKRKALRDELRSLLGRLPPGLLDERDRARLGQEVGSGTVSVVRMEFRATGEETALKTFDYSRSAIERRWRQGVQDMERLAPTLPILTGP